MKIDEVKVGEEYRVKYPQGSFGRGRTYRIRVEGIDKTYDLSAWRLTTRERKVRLARFTPLDERTGEPRQDIIDLIENPPRGNPSTCHVRATEIVEPWAVHATRVAEGERAVAEHEAAVERLDTALRSVGIEAEDFRDPGNYKKLPTVDVTLTHAQIERLCNELASLPQTGEAER